MTLDELSRAEPVYETLPGWREDDRHRAEVRRPAGQRAALRRAHRGAARGAGRPDLGRARPGRDDRCGARCSLPAGSPRKPADLLGSPIPAGMKSDRRSTRIKRRLTCELAVDGRRYRGIVLDLSETGVFVQTEATPTPGAPLRLRFHAADGIAIEVEASVARRQVAPRAARGVVRGGLGLRVDTPPPAYFELLGRTREASSARGPRGRRRAACRRRAASRAGGPVARATVRSARGRRLPSPRLAPPRSATVPRARQAVRRPALAHRRGERPRPRRTRKRALADLGRGWEVLGRARLRRAGHRHPRPKRWYPARRGPLAQW